MVDHHGLHAIACAGAEATRGHTQVRDAVARLVAQADPAYETEPIGLIAARPCLRPADILCTTGGLGQLTALDVGITAPTVADGDADATAMYKDAKLRKYGRWLEDLRRQGLDYKPLIWSCWGRPHADVEPVLKCLAARAARRRGLTAYGETLRAAKLDIALQVQARLAHMVRACTCCDEPEDVDQGHR